MLCMCKPNSFDAKIINNKTKGDWVPFVVLEAQCELTLVITIFIKATGEKFVGK